VQAAAFLQALGVVHWIMVRLLLHLVILLLASPDTRALLPELFSLEALEGGGGRVLATAPRMGRVVVLKPDSTSVEGWSWRVVADGGARALERPGEVDSRGGLEVLVLDAGRHCLVQCNRDFLPLAWEPLPGTLDLKGPDFLAMSLSRTLVAADGRTGTVVVRRPGEGWRVLLDYALAGALRPRALEVLGERVFLLDAGSTPALVVCGTEGGAYQRVELPGLVSLHRGEEGSLLLLFQVKEAGAPWLELRAWPEAHVRPLEDLHLAHLPLLARYEGGNTSASVRDFLLLPGQGKLLVAWEGQAARVVQPMPDPLP